MNKEYLPSKQFIARIIIFIIFIIISFTIYKIIPLIKNKSGGNTSVKLTVAQGIQNDSNENGIPDWEEKLWGLNPNKNGEKNKKLILEKRQSINPNASFGDNNTPLSKNDTLSHEFFAAIMSLQQTGKLDENAMSVISDSISEKIVPKPIPDIYTMGSITTVTPSIEKNKAYLDSFSVLVDKYKDADIGKELVFIIQAISSNDQQILSLVGSIAEAYRNFGSDLIKIPVPRDISSVHLSIANGYEKNAVVIENLIKILDDPLVGMEALINYKKYNDELASNIDRLSSVLVLE